MITAHINRVATAVPPHDVHDTFVGFAMRMLQDPRRQELFRRMAERGQIEHRWSSLAPARGCGDSVDEEGFYTVGRFPSTAVRMQRYEAEAPRLAIEAVAKLELGEEVVAITHLVVVSCTGFSAPGLDFALIERFGLNPSVERTMVGFMGCYAAINGLKLAHHIVRSQPDARVLLVCIELCTLHLQETANIEQVLTFLVFGDGCAAALISAESYGFAVESFRSLLIPRTAEHITWNIRDFGFDMVLSGQVPGHLGEALRMHRAEILPREAREEITLWAVHPGGRSVLDAVGAGLGLPQSALAESREVLRRFGNMSSATILFVLERLLRSRRASQLGCAMAFGPGLVAETMQFRAAGAVV